MLKLEYDKQEILEVIDSFRFACTDLLRPSTFKNKNRGEMRLW